MVTQRNWSPTFSVYGTIQNPVNSHRNDEFCQNFAWGKEKSREDAVTFQKEKIIKSNKPQQYSVRTVVVNDERLRQNHFICDSFRFETNSQLSKLIAKF
jgi:hypothetical protein